MSGEGPLARIAAPISLVRRPNVFERAASRMAFLWRILDHFEDPDAAGADCRKEREGATMRGNAGGNLVASVRKQCRDGPAMHRMLDMTNENGG